LATVVFPCKPQADDRAKRSLSGFIRREREGTPGRIGKESFLAKAQRRKDKEEEKEAAFAKPIFKKEDFQTWKALKIIFSSLSSERPSIQFPLAPLRLCERLLRLNR
jgi:hypothetical protein